MAEKLLSLLRFGSVCALATIAFAWSVPAAAQFVPTPQQTERFQKLPPAQREAIMRALAGGSGSLPATPVAVQPQLGAPTGASAAKAPEPQPLDPALRRIRPLDTILLLVDTESALNARGIAGMRGPLRSAQKVYVIDKTGVLEIPNVGRIPLAGLTEEEAVARLAAEPAFSGMKTKLRVLAVERELKPFGYEFFTGSPDAFALSADMPVPDDYVVGPGDVVTVQLYGKDSSQYELAVTREGQILFPGIGPIKVGGLTFARMQEAIVGRVQRQFIGMKASVTIGRTRSVQVFVLGDVERPGSYTVSGHATVVSAVFASGGIKRIGSMRDIQLKRSGKVVSAVDLYDLLLRGDNSADLRLQPGDVIFVPPIGRTAAIGGEVNRPAIYELKAEKTLADLIALAGGVTASAFPETVQIERIDGGRNKVLVNTSLATEEGKALALVDGDVVRIYPVLERTESAIFLSGFVHRPGTYQWSAGMRLADLLRTPAELPAKVDTNYVLVKREHPKDRTLSLLNASLTAAWQDPAGEANIPLQTRDTVYVFGIDEDRKKTVEPLLDDLLAQSRPDRPHPEVRIEGTIHHPSRYPFSTGMRVADLITAGGGLTDSAYGLEAELTRFAIKDGRERAQEVVSLDLAAVLRREPEKNITLQPYDQLVIRRIPYWKAVELIDIQGEVRFPGKYPITRGEKLSNVIKRAGGLTEDAFARGAVFVRESAHLREQEHLDKLARRLEQDIAVAAAEGQKVGSELQAALAEGKTLLQQLRATKAVGRVSIDLDRILVGDKDYDITVQPGDRIVIPQRPDEVTVLGEVYHPTSHRHNRGMSRDDYIQMSGGVTERGNDDAIYVVHANGAVSAPPRWFSLGGISIGPGDTVIVPLKLDRISTLKLFTDVSQIFYQLAVSAAALKVLNVF